MNKALLFCTIFAILSVNIGVLALDNCLLVPVNNSNFFNLCPFARRDRIINVSTTTPPYNFNVNLTLSTPHTTSCNKSVDVWATLVDQATETCYDLATAGPAYSLVDPNDENSGLIISYPKNTDESSPHYNKNLTVTLHCNKSADWTDNAVFSLDKVGSSIEVSTHSRYGCPYFTMPKFIEFLTQYKYPFIGGFTLLGIFFMFFGLRLFNYTVFLITAITGTFVSGILFFELVKFGSQAWILWVIFGACVIIGCVLGYLAVAYEKVGFFGLGAALGVIGGLLLYNTILIHYMQTGGSQNAIFYLILAVCGLIGGGLALWLWKDVIIIATALIGAYMSVRAVSVLIGGFPNELEVLNGAQELDAFAYIYLAVIALLAFAGMYHQFSVKRKQQEEEEDEEAQFKAYRRA